MDFQSGDQDPSGSSEWVQAYLLQTGEVPTDAKSIHLLASGDFMVTLDEQLIPMRLTESSSYVGDISQFAGRVATLKITNLTNSYNTSVVLDDIRFSPMSAVPELSSWALMALGLAGVGMAVRGKRGLATLVRSGLACRCSLLMPWSCAFTCATRRRCYKATVRPTYKMGPVGRPMGEPCSGSKVISNNCCAPTPGKRDTGNSSGWPARTRPNEVGPAAPWGLVQNCRARPAGTAAASPMGNRRTVPPTCTSTTQPVL